MNFSDFVLREARGSPLVSTVSREQYLDDDVEELTLHADSYRLCLQIWGKAAFVVCRCSLLISERGHIHISEHRRS